MIPLLRLIKRWAKTVGMNAPSKRPASFSSYTLTLMTIAWSQVRSQARTSDLLRLILRKSLGWLPNLQEDMSAEPITSRDYFWIKNRKGERFRCDTRFKIVENWPVIAEKSTGELFLEWLRYDPFGFLSTAVHLVTLGSGAMNSSMTEPQRAYDGAGLFRARGRVHQRIQTQ
jgi:hypothetical protein